MKLQKRFVWIFVVLIVVFVSAACSNPFIPEPTATAVPTWTPQPTYTPAPTYTPQPTFTPMPTYTLVPTITVAPKVPGIDTFVTYDGVSMKVVKVSYKSSHTYNGQDWTPTDPARTFLSVELSVSGVCTNLKNLQKWPDSDLGVRVVSPGGEVAIWKFGDWDKDCKTIVFVFVVSKSASSFTLVLPNGTEVPLNSFLK